MNESLMERRLAQEGRLRYASAEDIDALVEVCRGSFPLSLRWQGVRTVGERWWRAVVSTSAAETRVFELSGAVHGFCVLVTNGELWAGEEASRKVPWIPGLLSLFACPAIVAAKVRDRLIAAPERNRDSACRGVSKAVPPRTWIELIAVGPAMRGYGVARKLLEACEVRTVALGGAAIGLSVDADNEPAIRLYEAAGYVRKPAPGPRRVYLKELCPPSLEKAVTPMDAENRRAD